MENSYLLQPQLLFDICDFIKGTIIVISGKEAKMALGNKNVCKENQHLLV